SVTTVVLPGTTNQAAVSGSHVYVAAGSAGLHVLDISDPKTPVLVGTVDTPGIATRVVIKKPYAYVADASGLRVIDITNPTSPVIAGSVQTSNGASDLAVSGSYAYVAGSPSLQVVDVSNPTTPTIVGSWPHYTGAVAVSGTHLYVIGGSVGDFAVLD